MIHIEEVKIKQYLSKYQNPDVCLKDIVSTVNHYAGLAIKQDTYVFNDGTPLDLVNLTGTIPVSYKGNIYNIPVCIWLMDTHPKNAPLCYVKPTSDMSIKVSMFVDQNGKIYLPYLHDWVPNSSDILGLIQVMICTFGEQPPVYAKPREPYPSPRDSYASPRDWESLHCHIPGTSGALPSFYPPVMPSYIAGQGPASNASSYPPFPQYRPFESCVIPGEPASASTGIAGTITDEHIRASLMSAIEDKLKRRMREQYSQNQAELDTLKRTHQELVQGKARLDDILNRLEREQSELDKNVTILQDKEQELDKSISKLANEEAIDVDNAVTTTAPLFKQLFNAFAEEAATEDAIYYMGEALRQGVIDLDVFLKQVRTLSRKQFMLRATMRKCRQKAGLAC
ncbi:Tumor susceptibility gene 101 [Carabus blaptoides fortunei]